MTAIRTEGPIDQHTYLIDAVHDGIQGGFAVYLLKSREGKTCLIDAGTKESAKVIHDRLNQWGAWPPDMIILTHSHWDHTQGVEFLRKKAMESGHRIDVMASVNALPYLADQSYNICFNQDQVPFLDISDVTGLENNTPIDLGADLRLRIIETPGHMIDHISILDESNRYIYTGDAIGMKWGDGLIVANANSKFWVESEFYASLEKIKSLDIQGIGLGHFGCLQGAEARTFLDDTRQMYERWQEIFRQNRDKLNDIPVLTQKLISKAYSHLPEKMHEVLAEALASDLRLAVGAFKG